MNHLVIGNNINSIEQSYNISDPFLGLQFLSEQKVNAVILNLSDQLYTPELVNRFMSVIEKKKIPTLIIGRTESFKKLLKYDFVCQLSQPTSIAEIDKRLLEVQDYKTLYGQLLTLSRQNRTLPFYILGTLLIIEPLIKILYLKLDTGFEYSTVMDVVMSIEGIINNLEFWLLFPVAGFALFIASAYSLFIFTGVYVYSIISFLNYEQYTWPYVQDTPHVSNYLLLFFNTLLFIYFLIPENRRPFVTRTKNLFRRAKRLSVNEIAELMTDSTHKNYDEVNIINISKSGALIASKSQLSPEASYSLKLWGKLVQCEVIREIASDAKGHHFGVRFHFASPEDKNSFEEKINNIKAMKDKEEKIQMAV
ncbi:MAG: hypothetical protein CME62_03135 [Halobacteriovoraceae bacterium]|nr:hypothetical protein [Halobacteriovoraceae bacterium]|tara:strand:- start:7992 stop:9086 length:1095 start_codon:yes stop_codon:yes gene_type:complete